MALPKYMTEAAGQYMAEKIKEKAPLASPELTGIPKAPTALAGTSTTQIATTEFVKKAVDDAVAGIYTPMGSVPSGEDLPDNPSPGDIYTVDDTTIVNEDGEGKNVVRSLTGVVDTYDDLLSLDPAAENGAIYKVVNGDDGTGTYGTAYEDNSYFIYDGSAWTLLVGAKEYPSGTDYKYTENDGWTPIESGVDLSNVVTKDELAGENYVKHEELEPIDLSTVVSWFADPAPVVTPTYTKVDSTDGKNPKQEGWYVLSGTEYVLTEDETPQTGVDYYVKA